MNSFRVKTKVTEGGRVVIPAKVRDVMDIKIGENVTFDFSNNELRLRTGREALRQLQKMARARVSPDRSIVDEFLRERREEALKDG